MAILPIYPYNARVLRTETAEIKKADEKILGLVMNMFETMRAANGVGLAANQVGEGLSLFVIDISPVDGHKDEKPIAMINPKITDRWGDEVSYEEGCLSVPNVREEIFRPESIHVTYRDLNFDEQQMEVTDYFARVIQHEYDHLKGIFFTDYVRGIKKTFINPALRKIMKGEDEAEYEMARNVELAKK
jgi:peptide deformylase